MLTFAKKINYFVVVLSFLAILTPSVLAQDAVKDLYLNPSDIKSDQNLLSGKTSRIYVKVRNDSDFDLSGVVKIYDERTATYIGSDQQVSVLSKSTDDVFLDWTPDLPGDHVVAVRLIPWDDQDNPDNNKVSKTFFVDTDADGDGIGNRIDPDDDNDGVNDDQDALPFNPYETVDTDGDGIGDNTDEDDDNDGVNDIKDVFPLDGSESKDSDKDGVGDNADIFPLDSSETADSDGDGLGDNADPNDENMGPKPSITVSKTDVNVGETIAFNALKTRDLDGEVVAYEWNFGDGTTAEGVLVDHVFKSPGDYYVTLKTTDNKGEYREQQVLIQVRLYWQWIVMLVGAIALFILIVNMFRPKSRFHHKKMFKR